MSTEGKTVKLTEENKGKLRLFKNREPYEVEVPSSVSEYVEDCPKSVTITPMSHRDSEVRSRIKKKLTTAQLRSNYKAGISEADVTEYHRELSDLQTIDVEEKSEEDLLNNLLAFQRKWEEFTYKVKTKDMEEVWELEDELYNNSLLTVLNNCKSINWEDRSVEIKEGENDFLHPDFFQWILFQIEDGSYLRENEITGLL